MGRKLAQGVAVLFRSVIAKLEAIADLRPDEVAEFLAVAKNVRQIPPRLDIISEGDRPEHVQIIVDGWAASYKMLPNGSRQIVAFLIPGDFCDPHVALLEKMDHGIVAITRCRVAFITSGELDQLTANHNGLTKALWWATLVDKSILRSWVVNTGRRTAYQRVAHLLCELHLRMTMVGLVTADRFDLPPTQDMLADATGLTAVHTNRILQKLRQDELIELRSGSVTVLDVARLREVAGFDPSYLHIKRRTAAPE